MIDRLLQLFQEIGLFALIPVLFIVGGVGVWINILWGLATGGPRAVQAPGAPYLYDRVFYLLHLFLTVGWTFALLSFVAITEAVGPADGFMTGWGIGAIGVGLLLLLRGDMIADAMRYKAEHGFWLLRSSRDMQRRQWESYNPLLLKLFCGIFIVVGAGASVVNLPHFPNALKQAVAGARILLSFFATP